MTKDEALKMAIEALEHASERSIIIDAYEEIINACKEALNIANCDLKQPVAWQWLQSGHMRKKIPKTATPEHWRPLYTHPAQPWQGLTKEEIKSFKEVWGCSTFAIEDIQASLKVKNHGT